MGAVRLHSLSAAAAAAGTASTPQFPPASSAGADEPLKIVHVLRAPVGGLFRHVLDIAAGQVARGHRVGLIADSSTGGARADAIFADLQPRLALGVLRLPIARQLSLSDLPALRLIDRRITLLDPDVVHGHGAKGAALARLSRAASGAVRAYTPHGGSLVYRPGTLAGGFYRALEWLLKWRTDLFLFESSYAADLYCAEIGRPPTMVRIVHNGVAESEFAPVATKPDATDLVCVGELRPVKGVDLLIAALAALQHSGRRVSLTIAGEGPQGAELKEMAVRLGVAEQVRFLGHRPAREAFACGRLLVVSSRAESLPYIVLEAAAAAVPIVATRVGGIPEIFGADGDRLVAPDDTAAIAAAIAAALDDPATAERVAASLRSRVKREFSAAAMVESGLAAYREAIALHKLGHIAAGGRGGRKLAQFT